MVCSLLLFYSSEDVFLLIKALLGADDGFFGNVDMKAGNRSITYYDFKNDMVFFLYFKRVLLADAADVIIIDRKFPSPGRAAPNEVVLYVVDTLQEVEKIINDIRRSL